MAQDPQERTHRHRSSPKSTPAANEPCRRRTSTSAVTIPRPRSWAGFSMESDKARSRRGKSWERGGRKKLSLLTLAHEKNEKSFHVPTLETESRLALLPHSRLTARAQPLHGGATPLSVAAERRTTRHALHSPSLSPSPLPSRRAKGGPRAREPRATLGETAADSEAGTTRQRRTRVAFRRGSAKPAGAAAAVCSLGPARAGRSPRSTTAVPSTPRTLTCHQ